MYKCIHGVAYNLERLFKNFLDIFGQPEDVAEPHPFFVNVENVRIIPILVSNKN